LLHIARVVPSNLLGTPVEQAEDALKLLLDRLREADLREADLLYSTFEFRAMARDFLAINAVINRVLPLGLARSSVEVDDLPESAAFAIAGVIAAKCAQLGTTAKRHVSSVLVKPLPVYNHLVSVEVAPPPSQEQQQQVAVTACIQGFASASMQLPPTLAEEAAQATVNLMALLTEANAAWMFKSPQHRLVAVHAASQSPADVRAAMQAAAPDANVSLYQVKLLPRGCRVGVIFTCGFDLLGSSSSSKCKL
jgi:hypothetical protein